MVKRKKRKPKADEKITSVLGVAWYRKEQWERLREVSVDSDMLEAKYEEWKMNAELGLRRLEKTGILVRKVDVDLEELLHWCNAQKRPVDGEARSLFAAAKLREMEEGRE